MVSMLVTKAVLQWLRVTDMLFDCFACSG